MKPSQILCAYFSSSVTWKMAGEVSGQINAQHPLTMLSHQLNKWNVNSPAFLWTIRLNRSDSARSDWLPWEQSFLTGCYLWKLSAFGFFSVIHCLHQLAVQEVFMPPLLSYTVCTHGDWAHFCPTMMIRQQTIILLTIVIISETKWR